MAEQSKTNLEAEVAELKQRTDDIIESVSTLGDVVKNILARVEKLEGKMVVKDAIVSNLMVQVEKLEKKL